MPYRRPKKRASRSPSRSRKPLPPRQGFVSHPYTVPRTNAFLEAAKLTPRGCIPTRQIPFEELEEYVRRGAPPHLRERAAQLAARQGISFGKPSRNWELEYPTKGTERHELRNPNIGCGDECFLAPEQEGFPMCAKLQLKPRNPANRCLPEREGMQAAYNRARQTRHQDVADVAAEMLQRTCPDRMSAAEVQTFLRALKKVKGETRSSGSRRFKRERARRSRSPSRSIKRERSASSPRVKRESGASYRIKRESGSSSRSRNLFDGHGQTNAQLAQIGHDITRTDAKILALLGMAPRLTANDAKAIYNDVSNLRADRQALVDRRTRILEQLGD